MAVKKALAIAVQTGVPTLLIGDPGVGKTSFVNQLGMALNKKVVTVIASIREPSDFAGLPVVRESGVVFEPPAWARELGDNGILFLDELTTASPSVQKALLRVVLERVVGDLTLSPNVWIIAAANPPSSAAGGWDLAAPLANRFCHLKWTVDPSEWCNGIVYGFGAEQLVKLPKGWENGLLRTHALVASFIKRRPDLLVKLPNEASEAGGAWPSPRSWAMAARVLTAAEAVEASDESFELICGCVGEAAAIEFTTWKSGLDLPEPQEILEAGRQWKLPNRADIAYVALSGMTAFVLQDCTQDKWQKCWSVFSAVIDQGGSDIIAPMVKTLAERRPPGFTLPTDVLRKFLPLINAMREGQKV